MAVSEKRKKVNYILLVIVLIIWVGVRIFYHPEENSKPKRTHQKENYVPKVEAYNACKYFVKQKLKAPATAKFKSVYHTIIKPIDPPTNKRIKIISYVDSQNSFGAMIRTHFICIVKKINRDWYLDSLYFNAQN